MQSRWFALCGISLLIFGFCTPVHAQYATSSPSVANFLASSTTLSLVDLLSATYRYHPKTRVIQEDIIKAQSNREGSLGAFDWYIEQSTFTRTSGYYDGRYIDQSVSRYLGDLNAKISAGYRVSDGEFPVYEAEDETLTDGEANVSLSLSLLRDRDIDQRRFSIGQTDIAQEQALSIATLELNKLLLDAGLTYIKWYMHGHQLNIARSLLDLAEKRQQAIKSRVTSGDLAKIVELEFEVTLMDRVAAVEAAEQALLQQSAELSLYYRDSAGKPIDLAFYSVPNDVTLNQPATITDADLQRFIEQHPVYQQLVQDIEKTQQGLRFAKNSRLPQLDLKVKLAEDIGSGPDTLDGFESYAGLHFSMPIERRKANADINIKQAELRQLNAKLQLQREELKTQLYVAQTNLENLSNVKKIRQRQAELAIKLVGQEQKRFDQGDSDLFLLNSRETTSGRAQLEALYAQVNFYRQQLGYLAVAAKLAEIPLNND